MSTSTSRQEARLDGGSENQTSRVTGYRKVINAMDISLKNFKPDIRWISPKEKGDNLPKDRQQITGKLQYPL